MSERPVVGGQVQFIAKEFTVGHDRRVAVEVIDPTGTYELPGRFKKDVLAGHICASLGCRGICVKTGGETPNTRLTAYFHFMGQVDLDAALKDTERAWGAAMKALMAQQQTLVMS